MKVVVKLTSGELIIGDADVGTTDNTVYQVTLADPMIIDRDGEGMKMRDPLIFSVDDTIVLRSQDIMYAYEPISALSKYHTKSVEYNKTLIKPNVGKYINEAIEEINDMMQPENNNALSFMFKTVGGGTVH